MKKLKHLLPLSLLLLVVLAGCNKSGEIINDSVYSGEELFRGIFLLEGEVSEQIPSLAPVLHLFERAFAERADVQERVKERNNYMVSKVSELDPQFFSDLETAISSDDVSEIEYAIKRGNELLRAVILPDLYNPEDHRKVVELASTVNPDDFDTSTNEGLEAYVEAVYQKVSDIPMANTAGDAVNDTNQGKCLFLYGVVAVAVWDVAAVVNYAVIFNVVGKINVAWENNVEVYEEIPDVITAESFGSELLVYEISQLNK